jgi:hypothetical protein
MARPFERPCIKTPRRAVRRSSRGDICAGQRLPFSTAGLCCPNSRHSCRQMRTGGGRPTRLLQPRAQRGLFSGSQFAIDSTATRPVGRMGMLETITLLGCEPHPAREIAPPGGFFLPARRSRRAARLMRGDSRATEHLRNGTPMCCHRRSSPFLRCEGWLFRETRAYPKKTRAQSENGCALGDRPSTGTTVGCGRPAVSTTRQASVGSCRGRRNQKENPGTCQGGPEALPRHKEMTRPVTSTLKAVPGRATTTSPEALK